MVLPFEEPVGPQVRVVRSSDGRFIGFQDPALGSRFISRAEALGRLTFSVETSDLVDSFDNHVGVGSIRMPSSGIEIGYKIRTVTDLPLTSDPSIFNPDPNQQIVERVVFVKSDGTLTTMETSYKLGQAYDPASTGGRWRQSASEALGLKEGERLPTADLQRAVVLKEFFVRTIE